MDGPSNASLRVNPPLTSIFEEELVLTYELFFRLLHRLGAQAFKGLYLPGSDRALL